MEILAWLLLTVLFAIFSSITMIVGIHLLFTSEINPENRAKRKRREWTSGQ